MTTTLIVLAHPDGQSFNASWARTSHDASVALGHNVLLSDLCAMNFDPVEKSSHYDVPDTSSHFDVLKTQERAAATDRLPLDVQTEIDKFRQADRVIFHFPIWWFSAPAILKGWTERVLANGAMHSTSARFDTGRFRETKVLFCVTTGSKAAESAFNGKEGDVQMLLWPFAYIFRYLGCTVLTPKIIHGVHGYHKGTASNDLQARLRQELAHHPQMIADFDAIAPLRFNADKDFDADGRLLPSAPSHSHFIRKSP